MSATFLEIRPRELKDELYELDGISSATIDAHHRLYQGYVMKRNEILAKLAAVDLEAANQVYSDVRALKIDLTFAIGGIKNHEIYFEHLGGDGGNPTRRDRDAHRARLRVREQLAGRHEGDRHGRSRLGLDGVRLGRGTPLQLHRRRAEHVPRLERDAARRARRLRARVLPRLPDRPRRRTSRPSSGTSTGTWSTAGSRRTAFPPPEVVDRGARRRWAAGSSARCRSATGCRASSAARTSARAGAGTSARQRLPRLRAPARDRASRSSTSRRASRRRCSGSGRAARSSACSRERRR